MFNGQNPIIGAMLSSLGAMLRSFGYDEKYLVSLIEPIANDVHDITSFVHIVALENKERLERIEQKLDLLLAVTTKDHVTGAFIDGNKIRQIGKS